MCTVCTVQTSQGTFLFLNKTMSVKKEDGDRFWTFGFDRDRDVKFSREQKGAEIIP